MRIAQRLYLAVAPAVIGVILVAALGYWGAYARQVPEIVIVVAAVASIGSLILAWRNTRYVATRIERLASTSRTPRLTDELVTIERVVDNLSSEVTVARESSAERERIAAARVDDYATLLAEVSSAVGRRIADARLPMHILLENRFGDLNENQEEMLSAARSALEEADAELRRMREIAHLDQGTLRLRRDPLRAGDLLASLMPTLKARAERARVRLDADVAPALPPVHGDPARLREAIDLLIAARIAQTLPDDTVQIAVDRDGSGIAIRIRHGAFTATPAEELLARRLIEAHGGQIETTGGATVIRLT